MEVKAKMTYGLAPIYDYSGVVDSKAWEGVSNREDDYSFLTFLIFISLFS